MQNAQQRWASRVGDSDWVRTSNLNLRRVALYPIELQSHRKNNSTLTYIGQAGLRWAIKYQVTLAAVNKAPIISVGVCNHSLIINPAAIAVIGKRHA